jgi:hypothetical protein
MRLMSEKQSVFVVSQHRKAVKLSSETQHQRGVGAPRHQVTDEDNPVIGRRAQTVEKLAELSGAAVYISYPD